MRTFIYRRMYYEIAQTLRPKARLAFYDAVNKYAILDEEPQDLCIPAKRCFILVKPVLDRDIEKYRNKMEQIELEKENDHE